MLVESRKNKKNKKNCIVNINIIIFAADSVIKIIPIVRLRSRTPTLIIGIFHFFSSSEKSEEVFFTPICIYCLKAYAWDLIFIAFQSERINPEIKNKFQNLFPNFRALNNTRGWDRSMIYFSQLYFNSDMKLIFTD